ncbi:MAG: sialate O-acetylesterase [Saccharofermentanales bacterium]
MLRDFSKENFDIIIQAGQSNSEGCGQGDVEKPYSANENIWYLNNDFSISVAQERIWGNSIVGDYSLSFAKEYADSGKLQSGRKVLIVRSAVGGTGFLDGHWKPNDDLCLRMMEMIRTALDINSGNKLVAFLWHQGETDASLNAGHKTHYNNLSTLINNVRKAYKCENLPFIAGDFVHHWKYENMQICEPVINAIKAVCSDIGNSMFVETTGLQSNDQKIGNQDTIHFCREALYQLGVKYFKAYEGLTPAE